MGAARDGDGAYSRTALAVRRYAREGKKKGDSYDASESGMCAVSVQAQLQSFTHVCMHVYMDARMRPFKRVHLSPQQCSQGQCPHRGMMCFLNLSFGVDGMRTGIFFKSMFRNDLHMSVGD